MKNRTPRSRGPIGRIIPVTAERLAEPDGQVKPKRPRGTGGRFKKKEDGNAAP